MFNGIVCTNVNFFSTNIVLGTSRAIRDVGRGCFTVKIYLSTYWLATESGWTPQFPVTLLYYVGSTHPNLLRFYDWTVRKRDRVVGSTGTVLLGETVTDS